MDLGQVDILDIVGGVVVLDLSASPVEAFDFNSLAVLDCSIERDWIGQRG